MSFSEIDEARKTVTETGNRRRNRKRKSADITDSPAKPKLVSDCRTGRWTAEETDFCDKLIAEFEAGNLPIMDGIKLNDFLGKMLKSKQSRLTKKMKNAKLSLKTFERNSLCISDISKAREFSNLEKHFIHNVECRKERAEIRFHMQNEWRRLFQHLCAHIGQPLDFDRWLSSVEEMKLRVSRAQEITRMARRNLMTSFALRVDTQDLSVGVFIDHASDDKLAADEYAAAVALGAGGAAHEDAVVALLSDISTQESTKPSSSSANGFLGKNSLLGSAPFLSKAITFIQRHNVPFEHIELWVPSSIPNATSDCDGKTVRRLCYAGNATVDFQVGPEGKCTLPLSAEEQFNFESFGDYSQKFSFDVGCGLPGHVYQSGMSTWKRSVHNHHHFERGGGAKQWGMKTVVGIPIASPNVGRIVAILYSRHDRNTDQELIARLSAEFRRVCTCGNVSPRFNNFRSVETNLTIILQ